MRVLITGSQGQLGWELQRSVPVAVELLAEDADQLDITDADAVQRRADAFRPDWIINAAAYTAVDRAEDEPALAQRINADGAANLARAAATQGARMVQVSTDYVFDGQGAAPYRPTDATNPQCVYGRSKLEGEQRVREALGNNALILRTAWVYSAHGQNFVKTILRLCAEKDRLTIVADQLGTPTWASGLARAIWGFVRRGITGTHHWTDAGVASWYDFAVSIQQQALELGLLQRAIPILPIRSADFPQKAPRPPCAVLDKQSSWQVLEIQPRHWSEALAEMMKEMSHV